MGLTVAQLEQLLYHCRVTSVKVVIDLMAVPGGEPSRMVLESGPGEMEFSTGQQAFEPVFDSNPVLLPSYFGRRSFTLTLTPDIHAGQPAMTMKLVPPPLSGDWPAEVAVAQEDE